MYSSKCLASKSPPFSFSKVKASELRHCRSLILSKSRPSLYLPAIMILWGVVTCCMAAIKSYRQLVALRFVVGVLESGFAPGVLLILSSWYKREEQSKRFAVYISAAILSGAFGGLLAGAITKDLEGAHGIRGWRWLFIVEGAASIGWACIARFLLLDFPLTSKYLSEAERRLASERLLVADGSRASDEYRLGPFQAIKRSLANWRVWLFTAGYMVIVGSSTLSYFYPTLVEGLGYESHMAQYMVRPAWILARKCRLKASPDRANLCRGFRMQRLYRLLLRQSLTSSRHHHLKYLPFPLAPLPTLTNPLPLHRLAHHLANQLNPNHHPHQFHSAVHSPDLHNRRAMVLERTLALLRLVNFRVHESRNPRR